MRRLDTSRFVSRVLVCRSCRYSKNFARIAIVLTNIVTASAGESPLPATLFVALFLIEPSMGSARIRRNPASGFFARRLVRNHPARRFVRRFLGLSSLCYQ